MLLLEREEAWPLYLLLSISCPYTLIGHVVAALVVLVVVEVVVVVVVVVVMVAMIFESPLDGDSCQSLNLGG